jgi:hypothetical protein
MYRPGDHVIPQDLPRRFVCRVIETENLRLRAGTCQVLKLAPLEGPWPPGTQLVRLDKAVQAADRVQPLRPATPRRRAARRRATVRSTMAPTSGEAA